MATGPGKLSWSVQNISSLINCYQERSFLWNAKDVSYHDQKKRYGAWVEIAEEIKTDDFAPTAEDVRKKTNSLRTQYLAEKRKEKAPPIGSSSDDKYQSTWAYKAKFAFLDGVRKRASYSNVNQQDQRVSKKVKLVDHTADAEGLFAQTIACELRSLSSGLVKARLKRKIHNMVLEAREKEEEEAQSSFNSTPSAQQMSQVTSTPSPLASQSFPAEPEIYKVEMF